MEGIGAFAKVTPSPCKRQTVVAALARQHKHGHPLRSSACEKSLQMSSYYAKRPVSGEMLTGTLYRNQWRYLEYCLAQKHLYRC